MKISPSIFASFFYRALRWNGHLCNDRRAHRRYWKSYQFVPIYVSTFYEAGKNFPSLGPKKKKKKKLNGSTAGEARTLYHP